MFIDVNFKFRFYLFCFRSGTLVLAGVGACVPITGSPAGEYTPTIRTPGWGTHRVGQPFLGFQARTPPFLQLFKKWTQNIRFSTFFVKSFILDFGYFLLVDFPHQRLILGTSSIVSIVSVGTIELHGRTFLGPQDYLGRRGCAVVLYGSQGSMERYGMVGGGVGEVGDVLHFTLKVGQEAV